MLTMTTVKAMLLYFRVACILMIVMFEKMEDLLIATRSRTRGLELFKV